jgi:hypothetical protein
VSLHRRQVGLGHKAIRSTPPIDPIKGREYTSPIRSSRLVLMYAPRMSDLLKTALKFGSAYHAVVAGRRAHFRAFSGRL